MSDCGRCEAEGAHLELVTTVEGDELEVCPECFAEVADGWDQRAFEDDPYAYHGVRRDDFF